LTHCPENSFEIYLRICEPKPDYKVLNQTWWRMWVIPALRRWWQEDHKFKTSLGGTVQSSQTQTQAQNKTVSNIFLIGLRKDENYSLHSMLNISHF
jgi:hypothetical protein